ncbi:MAG TPA: 4a-hydroxytetrahydrobiopterin dehydratase [Dehalococcoidia bacterium]|nr:4a-hydroxytetrahydrobiopterin dehydratase [Dehalococcoidia bacterium]
MPLLRDDDIDARLINMSGWRRHGDEIRKAFEFAGFREAMAFVNRVAALAEAADHHPDIAIAYNRVTLTLSTHSEGGITDKDMALAAASDAAAHP